jgi:hypothetical protein
MLPPSSSVMNSRRLRSSMGTSFQGADADHISSAILLAVGLPHLQPAARRVGPWGRAMALTCSTFSAFSEISITAAASAIKIKDPDNLAGLLTTVAAINQLELQAISDLRLGYPSCFEPVRMQNDRSRRSLESGRG